MPRLRKLVDLRLAVIFVVLVPLLLIFGGGGLLALGAVERQLEERMQEDISLIARTLRLPMSRALERKRERDVDQALRSAIDFGRVYGVYLYDADGRLVTQVDQLPRHQSPTGAASELRQIQDKDQLEDYRSIGGQEVFSLFTPLTNTGGQVIGMLQITRQVSEMRHYINNLRWRVLPTLLAFSLLFILVVVVGHHFAIGRPLRRLTDHMDRIAGGEVRVRSAPSGPREIHRLGERFNLMLDGIDDRDRSLAAQRERQLQLAERLRQSEKFAMAGRLAAGVAHELGTPLSVVDGHAQRLLRQQRPETREHETLTKIRRAAAEMAEVVQHLLGFGRGSAAQYRPIAVRRLVALAAADVRTLYDSAKTDLRIDPGPDVATINADEGRLREALAHLLKNALQAARGGRARLGWRSDAGTTTLFVEDSGAGIDEEDRSRIFEPFFTTKEPGEGSGLGLTVVQGILADHGAEIGVYGSRLGGAGFRIEFPQSAGAA